MNRAISASRPEADNGEGIRPRNRRLISTLGEQELVSTSSTSTPGGSRAASPLPSRHPSRSTSKSNGLGGRIVLPDGGTRSPGIWQGGWTGSWTKLQGIASSVLGVDVAEVTGGSRTKKNESWGPEGLPRREADNIGVGTTADREAKVRARKMRGVLEGREDDLNVRKDTNGNYKRRSSADETRQLTPVEEDSMVYVHHVQPNDTLAGVILRYNCQPAVFRKANRFWPNDSIQTRKVVVIPVDACTVKGRPCDPPSFDNRGVDLLAPTPDVEESPIYNTGSSWPGASISRPEASLEATEVEEEQPWTHVRWVLIDSSPSSRPVEIARMPRKTLGYFPPRRRKSSNTISVVSTPRGSMDFPQFATSPPSVLGSPPTRRLSLLPPKVGHSAGSYFPPPVVTRPRRESVSEAADRLGWMRGPGGVGTLTGKNVRKPGPSQDGLNKWVNQNIPGLAIDSLPSASLVGGDTAHFGFDADLESIAEGTMRASNGAATSSGAGQGLGIENAAAAIEGWVRRIGGNFPGTPLLRPRPNDGSDLIELREGSEDGRFDLGRRDDIVDVKGKGKKGD